MANYGNYDIPLFEDDIQTIKEFFRIVLNTIFFHRWLGETKFEDTESIFSNITYVKVKNDNFCEFEACSENLSYELNDNVQVVIPLGDYNSTKRIIGKIDNKTMKVLNKYFDIEEGVLCGRL